MATIRTVHKYTLPFLSQARTEVSVPVRRGTFLSAAVQREEIQVWMAVEIDEELKPADFFLVGTGNEIESYRWFLSTIFLSENFPSHLFTSAPHITGGRPLV